VKQNRSKVAFSVYPNPVQDFITIKSVERMKNLKIYNVTGSLLRAVDMGSQSGSRDIDVSDLPKGIYMIKVNFSEGGTFAYRIIKE
jgi:hypothetical protein